MRAVPLDKPTRNKEKTSVHLAPKNKKLREENRIDSWISQPFSLATGRQPCAKKCEMHQTHSLQFVLLLIQPKSTCPPTCENQKDSDLSPRPNMSPSVLSVFFAIHVLFVFKWAWMIALRLL